MGIDWRDFIKATGAGTLGALLTGGWGATRSVEDPESWMVELDAPVLEVVASDE